MNKFAPIVFILLLSCGAALWFLASDSLNFYIKDQIQTLGARLTDQNVSVENVAIHSYQGSGSIANLRIYPKTSSELVTAEQPTIDIKTIDLVINRDSLKEEIIIIESLIITGLKASLNYQKNGSDLQKLLTRVQSNITQLLAIPPHNEHQKNNVSRLLKIKKVQIKKAELQLTKEKSMQEVSLVIPVMEWTNIGGDNGLNGHTLSIELFELLLIELDKQASSLK